MQGLSARLLTGLLLSCSTGTMTHPARIFSAMPSLILLLKRALQSLGGLLLALLVLFEEWGWIPLSRLLQALGRLRIWRVLEQRIAALPPRWALPLFAAPMVVLFPVKLLVLQRLATGHVLQAAVLELLSKLAGTAIVAWLFQLVQPALMQIGWFARWYPRWLGWKARWFALIRSSRPWRIGRLLRKRLRRWWQHAIQKQA